MKIRYYLAVFLILALGFTLSSYTFGQNITDITAKFCNGGKLIEDLSFSTDSAKTNEICVQFTNNSDQDASIFIGFPDGTTTQDELKIRTCKPESSIKEFGQYVLPYNKNLIIPAGKTIKQINKIRFPAGFEGISRGCLTYRLSPKEKISSNINIIIRQTSNIDVLVGSNFKRYIVLQSYNKQNKKIEIEKDIDGSIYLNATFINSGDVNELFQGSVKIYNAFGFSKIVNINQTNIGSNSIQKISAYLGKLPFYGLKYKITLSGHISPEILFNKDNLAPNLKENIKINEKTTILMIPRKIVSPILIVIIIYLILLYREKILEFILKQIKNKFPISKK